MIAKLRSWSTGQAASPSYCSLLRHFVITQLLLYLDFTNHSKIGMRDLPVGGLRIRDLRHLTMENVPTGSKGFAHPDYSLRIVAIEYAAHRIGRSRTASIVGPPPGDVCQSLALVQSEDVHFMHRWPAVFNPDNLHPFS